MLSYESLIAEARLRGMPSTKLRGILREYLQILILKELSRTEEGRRLYFTGGTYLRLVHNLKRFSEDLDFNTNKMTKKEFESFLKKVRIELRRIGMELNVRFAHWGNIFVAKFIFPQIEKGYSVISRYSKKEGITIKVETNNLSWKISSETQVISGFGELYPLLCTNRGVLFADKIDALNKKTRGRHLYDVMFMLAHKYPIDRKVLKHLGIKKIPLKVIQERVNRFSEADLKKQAEILRPFLFDEKDAELISTAHVIIPSLIEKY